MMTLLSGAADRPVLWRSGQVVSARRFLAQAQTLADALPKAASVINLCEDREYLLLGFVAALIAHRTTLLPPSRAPDVVAQVAQAHGPAAIIDDALVATCCADAWERPFQPPVVDARRMVAIGFTSGSTGTPKANAKTWAAFTACTAFNRQAFGQQDGRPMNVLATVPSQHMYGMETSVLLPLLADCAVAVERPLFPVDLVHALDPLPRPRLLVTTPIHLRAFVAAGLHYPAVDRIVCATAPLSRELAQASEHTFGAPLHESFGATETCIIAGRRTALDGHWHLYPGLRLETVEDGSLLHAPYYPHPVLLHDHIHLLDEERFVVEGRSQDLIEIAGKRASLGDIGQRLLAIAGVQDAAVVQASTPGASVQRLVAFVVAPDIDDAAILATLRPALDPAFLPRRLIRLDRLPRNETGKLRRQDLLALLESSS